MITKYNDFKKVNEKIIAPPNIPNTFNFWHGGNLDEFNDVISQKNGRYEFGAGLYLTTHYGTATKYAKGKRKLYLITVEKGVEIHDAFLDINAVHTFIDSYCVIKSRKEIKNRLAKYIVDGKIKAFYLNNIVLNEKAVSPSNTKYLRQFFVDNGIDYELVNNPFGWGELMMVLYNMKKIVTTTVVTSKDKIEVFDLLQ